MSKRTELASGHITNHEEVTVEISPQRWCTSSLTTSVSWDVKTVIA
jgi:hypothetical protein